MATIEMEILSMVDHFVGTKVSLATILIPPMSLFNHWCLIGVPVISIHSLHYNNVLSITSS